MRRLALPVAVLALGLTGCGQRPRGVTEAAGDEGPVQVVATSARAARLAARVGGRRAVVAILGRADAGAGAEGAVLSERDADALRRADLVVRSGGPPGRGADAALGRPPAGVRVLTLADWAVPPGDARWWADRRSALLAVGALRGAFVSLDPEGTPVYASAAAREAARIRERVG